LALTSSKPKAAPLKIYLAGPDCFANDAFERYASMKKVAKEHGMVAMSPLDSEVDVFASDILETIFKM
jgi:nucleoside 2-deoxyribosyltransferase